MRSLFSMLVDLNGRKCVIVGGGKVAERKVSALLEAGAEVAVISPKVSKSIELLYKQGRVRWVARPYVSGDGEGAFLIIAATDSRNVNEQVFQEAAARGQLITVADRAEWSTFMMPSVVRRGSLIISVSTSGTSPALANAICKQLAEQYGSAYEECLQFLRDFRMKVRELVKDAKQRQQLLRDAAGKEMLLAMQSGDFTAYRRRWLERLKCYSDGGMVHAHDHCWHETERLGSDADKSDD